MVGLNLHVYRDEATTAFIGAKWWVNNPGHVLVIPNAPHASVPSASMLSSPQGASSQDSARVVSPFLT